MAGTPPEGTTAPPSKGKRRKQRQRLSCVECARRRQKCDRQIPCSSCVSRGIPELCRWEPIVARPLPQRLPNGAPTTLQESTIIALSAKIAILEETVDRQNRLIFRNAERAIHSGEAGDTATVFPDQSWRVANNTEDDDTAIADDAPVNLTVVNMARLALAPLDEYIGGGTLLCELYKLENMNAPPFAQSTPESGPLSNVARFDNPLLEPIRQLASRLPSRPICDTLVEAFFRERDWVFGLPESWFKTSCAQMWTYLNLRCVCVGGPPPSPLRQGQCERCARDINPHWLLLLFSVLMLAPRRLIGTSADDYFRAAMETRRLIEDVAISSPGYSCAPTQNIAHGVALSSIAASLYGCYLTDRGRVSDAWKLTGAAIRRAQAAGLHRDPSGEKWEKMNKVEREIRLLSWWMLATTDRMYSLVLGRPPMAAYGSFDVRMVPGKHHGDASENPWMHYQHAFIVLMELVEETIIHGFKVESLKCPSLEKIESKYQRWLSKLHPSLNWRIPHPPPKSPTWKERGVAFQRHACAAYWLGGLVNLYRMRCIQVSNLPAPSTSISRPGAQSPHANATPAISPPSPADPTQPFERCLEVAAELIRVICDAHDEAARLDPAPPMPTFLFHYVYFVFDAAVALVGGLSPDIDPPHPRACELLALIDRAVVTLAAARDANAIYGEAGARAPSRAIQILAALRRVGRWDERFRSGGPAAQWEQREPGTFGLVADPVGGCTSFGGLGDAGGGNHAGGGWEMDIDGGALSSLPLLPFPASIPFESSGYATPVIHSLVHQVGAIEQHQGPIPAEREPTLNIGNDVVLEAFVCDTQPPTDFGLST